MFILIIESRFLLFMSSLSPNNNPSFLTFLQCSVPLFPRSICVCRLVGLIKKYSFCFLKSMYSFHGWITRRRRFCPSFTAYFSNSTYEMQFNWNNKYQQFLSIHVRYPSLRDPTLKPIDLLQKKFILREGKTASLGRAHKYLGIVGIYYFS